MYVVLSPMTKKQLSKLWSGSCCFIYVYVYTDEVKETLSCQAGEIYTYADKERGKR